MQHRFRDTEMKGNEREDVPLRIKRERERKVKEKIKRKKKEGGKNKKRNKKKWNKAHSFDRSEGRSSTMGRIYNLRRIAMAA